MAIFSNKNSKNAIYADKVILQQSCGIIPETKKVQNLKKLTSSVLLLCA